MRCEQRAAWVPSSRCYRASCALAEYSTQDIHESLLVRGVGSEVSRPSFLCDPALKILSTH